MSTLLSYLIRTLRRVRTSLRWRIFSVSWASRAARAKERRLLRHQRFLLLELDRTGARLAELRQRQENLLLPASQEPTLPTLQPTPQRLAAASLALMARPLEPEPRMLELQEQLQALILPNPSPLPQPIQASSPD